ncbi:hypothetical protein AB0N09_42130 [Streptomyces erythrochromogenes]
MIDGTRSRGIEVPQVIAEGGYGDTAAFRLGREECGLGRHRQMTGGGTHPMRRSGPSRSVCRSSAGTVIPRPAARGATADRPTPCAAAAAGPANRPVRAWVRAWGAHERQSET